MRFLLSAAFLVCYLPVLHANAQVATEIIRGGGHATRSTSNVVSYSAQCPSAGYEIRFLKESEQVQFIVKDGGDRRGSERSFDISGTQFGKTFLHKRLYGDFEINCGKGLVIFFLGVQLQRVGQPKVVAYHFAIDNSGMVLNDRGLEDNHFDEIDALIDH